MDPEGLPMAFWELGKRMGMLLPALCETASREVWHSDSPIPEEGPRAWPVLTEPKVLAQKTPAGTGKAEDVPGNPKL